MKVKVAVRNECSNTCTNALQCPQDVIIREGCGEKIRKKCDLLPKPPRTPPLRAKNIPFLLVVKLFLDISQVNRHVIYRNRSAGQNIYRNISDVLRRLRSKHEYFSIYPNTSQCIGEKTKNGRLQ